MNTTATVPPALASELPPDAMNVPSWLESALLVPRREGWTTSGGCDIHYFCWGNPRNPGLLLIHGFLAHARCFGFIAPFLAQRYHVVAFDLSGMGDSGVREHYPDSVRAAEVEDVARATGMFDHAVRPIVIAHSYGGHVALSAMRDQHAMFGGLIICDLMVLRPERLEAYFGAEKPLRSAPTRPNRIYPDYATAKSRFVLSPPQPVNVPSLFDYMAYHSLKRVAGGWTWKFDTSVFQSDFGRQERMFRQGEIIAETPGRKAIVYGQGSELFDDDSADYVHECGATDVPIIGIPGARHHLMLDEPIAFVSVLRTILAQWEVQSAR
ncbi:alpha/beta fold hydrolase [Chromatocurvus halotolerans]|uniref:Pimeloyl-ACP methyl ester carboxylesterase n=1 Tax=Chromatocurvus halotolerans TaxID=1132028 RepID=A0A4R2LD92_9GAMM|nr:alpha/beta hydrolase [Chromatocurvus halotolerans]TCO77315.1 pimeloyl-ACP methyl ester carboxylesterase [Chromatocurvus halotolerans]